MECMKFTQAMLYGAMMATVRLYVCCTVLGLLSNVYLVLRQLEKGSYLCGVPVFPGS